MRPPLAPVGRETPLTAAQRALLDAEPELPARVVSAAMRCGAGRSAGLGWEELMSIAAVGVLEAARRFDPARSASFREWAFFNGLHHVLDAARDERQTHGRAVARLRAAAMTYFADAEAKLELGVDTTESLAAKLAAFCDPLVGLAMMEVATGPAGTGGEDELVEREAAARAGAALREVLPPPGSEERRMLELHFVKRAPLSKVAEAMGVPESGYRSFVRRFHLVLGELRRGLAERGLHEMPPWREDLGGTPLGPDSGR